MALFTYHMFQGLPANDCNGAGCTSIASVYSDSAGLNPTIPLLNTSGHVSINQAINPLGNGSGLVSHSCGQDPGGVFADCECDTLQYSTMSCTQYAAGFGGTLKAGQAWHDDISGNLLPIANDRWDQLAKASSELWQILGQPTWGQVVDVTWLVEDPNNPQPSFPFNKYCIRYLGQTVGYQNTGPTEYVQSMSNTCPIQAHLVPAVWAQNNTSIFSVYNPGVKVGYHHGIYSTAACVGCSQAPYREITPAIDVCGDSASPSYYELTLQGCGQHSGYSWPTLAQALAATVNMGANCCPVNCTGVFICPVPIETGVLGYTLTNNFVNSIGTNNGSISVDVLDPANSYIATGVPNYAYILEPPLGGDAGGGINVPVCSGATSNTNFTFDSNATYDDYPVDTGSPPGMERWPTCPYAGSATQGLGPGIYRVYVIDGADLQNYNGTEIPAGCVITYEVILTQSNPCIPECNNTIALNYVSGATGCDPTNSGICDITDYTCCLYCDKSTTHHLTDVTGTANYGQMASVVSSTTTNATDPAVSDGSFTSTVSYHSLLTSLTVTQTQNWSPFYRFYSHPTAADQLAHTNQTAVTTAASPGSFAANTTHLATAALLAPGWYSMKIYIFDTTQAGSPNDEIEWCETWYDFIVKAPTCTDSFANNTYTGSVDPALLISTQALCTYPCGFTNGALNVLVNALNCNCYDLDFTLTYLAPITTVTVETWYDDLAGGGAILIQSNSTSAATYTYQACNSPGNYFFIIKSTTTAGGSTYCDSQTGTVNVPAVVTGCDDPLANNYNPSVTCPCTTCCQYPTYECDIGAGTCSDPYPGPPGPYTTAAYGTAALALAACQTNCIPPIVGCTDPNAVNWNAANNVPCNSGWVNDCCIYKVCLDPTASNYEWCGPNYYPANYLRQSQPQCCEYPCTSNAAVIPTGIDATVSTGCLSNNDGSASVFINITNGATQYTVKFYDNWGNLVYDAGTLITAAGNPIFVVTPSIFPPGTYKVKVIDNWLPTPCTVTASFAIGVDGAACGCMNPNAINYNPLATIDDGSCIIPGCTDPNASNYNPIANTDDGSCIYQNLINPCVPKYMANAIYGLTSCITKNGTNFLRKLKTGMSTECSTMEAWKIILMEYLLSRVGLECIYSCADHTSPDRADAYTFCGDEWADGGSLVLDPALPATVWAPGSVFQYEITLYNGAGIRFYFKTSTSYTTNCTTANFLSCLGDQNCIHWQCWDLCNPSMQGTQYTSSTSSSTTANAVLSNVGYLIPSFTTNFIDNFVNFAQKNCVDCKNLTEDVADLGYLTREEYTEGNFIFPYF